MTTLLEQISIVEVHLDGVHHDLQPINEDWRASRFDGDRRLTIRRDDAGEPVLNEQTKEPIYIPNPEQIFRFQSSLEIELLSRLDHDVVVVLIAKVVNDNKISLIATDRIGLPAHGTCTVELRRSGGSLVEHQIEISAFVPKENSDVSEQ